MAYKKGGSGGGGGGVTDHGALTGLSDDDHPQYLKVADAGNKLFVSNSEPSVSAGVPYLWVQTGLGGGADMTFWVEDGI